MKFFVFVFSYAAIFSQFAWSFSYPNSPATPERAKRLNENLLRLYNKELKEISNSNLEIISERMKVRNKKFLEELNTEPVIDEKSNSKFQPASMDEVQKILDQVSSHPVVGDDAIYKYDRERFNIGFCFGRAAFVHLELLRRGVNPRNLGKVFAIGKFRFGNAIWDFHVATVVRGPKNEWWAVDPVTDKKIEPIEVWMSKVEKLDLNPAHPLTRFYFSDAVKFHPFYGAYGPDNLYFPYFNNYFVDLAKWFDDHPVNVSIHP